jgi:outer membrane receptor protein involved in Fe transport
MYLNERNGLLISREVLVRRMSTHTHVFSAAFLVAAAFCCSGAHAQILIHFDLPAQSLARSLTAIGTATNTGIGFNSSQVAGIVAPSLKADLTVDGALSRVLAGTGLRPQHLNDRTIVIAAAESSTADSSEIKLLLVKASAPAEAGDQVATPQADVVADSTDNPSSVDTRKNDLHEIVVTGTHLQGTRSSPSAIQIYTRDDIDQAGIGTVAQFIQTLPQNFGGGASENTIGGVTGGGSAANGVGGAGVNLRGLGNDSTLVLVNGHRLAPGNTNGNFVDVSMIPLSAVDRIEVVPDGSSAIYGSDAVGGVINFILRNNFDGLESRARFGGVSDGGSKESQVGQTGGTHWNSGDALLSYEFYDRTPLSAADRSYSESAVQPFTLLPEQVRQSVFLSVNQKVNSDVSLFADGTFSHRSTYYDASVAGLLQQNPAVISAYSGTVGARFRLKSNWYASPGAKYCGIKAPLTDSRLRSNARICRRTVSTAPV